MSASLYTVSYFYLPFYKWKWKSLSCFQFFESLQARILEWLAILFSRESSQPRDWIQVSYIAGGFFTNWATREPKPTIHYERTGDFK